MSKGATGSCCEHVWNTRTISKLFFREFFLNGKAQIYTLTYMLADIGKLNVKHSCIHVLKILRSFICGVLLTGCCELSESWRGPFADSSFGDSFSLRGKHSVPLWKYIWWEIGR